MNILYDKDFDNIRCNPLYPIVGFFYSYIELESSNEIINDEEGTFNWERLRGFLTDPTIGKSELRILPMMRVSDNYQLNFPKTDRTTGDYRLIVVLYFDMTVTDYPKDINELTNDERKELKIAFVLDGYSELYVDKSNLVLIDNLIGCDFSRLLPDELNYIEHLDGYQVDKRNAVSKYIGETQFVEKTSGLEVYADDFYNTEKNYNTFILESSGKIDI